VYGEVYREYGRKVREREREKGEEGEGKSE